MKNRCEAAGFEVDGARNGREALRRLREFRPDLVLLDVDLPGLSGLDVLSAIRRDQLDMAVIIVTGLSSEETAVEALRLGADDYVPKPIDIGDFRAVVDRTVGRLQLRRRNSARSRHIEEQSRQLERELARAAQLQADLLPAMYPKLRDFEMAAACLPAHEVGGDFYDWQQMPSGTLSLTVGDVMGKGMPAALLMATVRAIMRGVTEYGPVEAVQRTAQALDGDLTRSGSFITLFHAQLDVVTGRLRYVDAGHGYVLVRRANGTVHELTPWGLPLGVDADEVYREGSLFLKPGDTLIVYSDGLTEARAEAFRDRDAVASYAANGGDAEGIVRDLVAEVAQVKPLPDDLTVVVLRRRPRQAAAA